MALAVRLKQRGHRVTFLTSPFFEDLAAKYGLDFVPIGTMAQYERFANHPDLFHPRRSVRVFFNTLGVPSIRSADERHTAITVAQVLSHTAGMPDVETYDWDRPEYDAGAAERLVRSLRDRTMIGDPGARFAYSNMAFEVLGDLIAKVAGVSFEECARAHPRPAGHDGKHLFAGARVAGPGHEPTPARAGAGGQPRLPLSPGPCPQLHAALERPGDVRLGAGAPAPRHPPQPATPGPGHVLTKQGPAAALARYRESPEHWAELYDVSPDSWGNAAAMLIEAKQFDTAFPLPELARLLEKASRLPAASPRDEARPSREICP